MNIYELFNCKNKEEYLNKLYNDEKWRKENKEFFQNLFIDKELLKINDSIALEFLYSDFIIDDKLLVYYQSSDLKLLKIGVYDNFKAKEIVEDIKGLECQSVILINNTYNDITSCMEWFENIGIRINDYVLKQEIIDEKFKYKKKDLEYIFYIPTVNNEINLNRIQEYNDRRFDRNIINLMSENLKEIVNENIIGSNYSDMNIKKIKNNIKFAYQYDIYESVNMILLDEKNNVNKILNIGKGVVNNSFVNFHKIVTEIDFDYDSKCVLFHNHPSGDLKVSMSDLKVTERIENILKELNINLVEHFIVSKEGVHTFNINEEILAYNREITQEFDLRLENNKWKNKNTDMDLER